MYQELGPKISLAIEKGHNMRSDAVSFLQRAGFNFHVWENGSLHAAVDNDDYLRSIDLNRGGDIPYRLGEGASQFGIFGRDVLREAQLEGIEVEEIVPLGISPCRVVLEVPIDSPYKKPEDLYFPDNPDRLFRVATSYPYQAAAYFEDHAYPILQIGFIKYRGGEEVAVNQNAAEAVIAAYVSGTSANENGLRLIAVPDDRIIDSRREDLYTEEKRMLKVSTLMESEAVLAASSEFLDEHGSDRIVKQFINRIAQTAGRKVLRRSILPIVEMPMPEIPVSDMIVV
ncbi:MAG: ATP phosphoribosyltransferase [Patescibacteria group bacterium]